MTKRSQLKGLYIHLPFCRQICTYCDFPKRVSNDTQIDKYLKYLEKEMMLRILNDDFDTIYIGGGTPSSLKLEHLEQLFVFFYTKFPQTMRNLLEFTIELNPEDISLPLVDLLVKYHINRVSVGIQSLNNDVLKKMGRTVPRALSKRIETLRTKGIENINVDLIYGFCQEETVIKDIMFLASLAVKHFSIYSLILEPKTILYHQYKRKLFLPFDEKEEAMLYDKIVKKLALLGYEQYEISNFCNKGFESIHNRLYWQDHSYVGVGLGASGYDLIKRWTNTNNLTRYYQLIDQKCLPVDEETIYSTITERLVDYVMLALRTVEGIDLKYVEDEYKIKFIDILPCQKMILDNFLVLCDGHLSINPIYFYVSNHLIVSFIEIITANYQ